MRLCSIFTKQKPPGLGFCRARFLEVSPLYISWNSHCYRTVEEGALSLGERNRYWVLFKGWRFESSLFQYNRFAFLSEESFFHTWVEAWFSFQISWHPKKKTPFLYRIRASWLIKLHYYYLLSIKHSKSQLICSRVVPVWSDFACRWPGNISKQPTAIRFWFKWC